MSARHSWVQAVPMDGENGENAILFVVNQLFGECYFVGFFSMFETDLMSCLCSNLCSLMLRFYIYV